MKVVSGRFAESRAYFLYCVALFRPGVEVPVFQRPTPFTGDLAPLHQTELMLIIEEGRRHLDRQYAALDRVRNRAATALTVGLAALAAVTGVADSARHGPKPAFVSWAVSAVLVALSVAGSAAVLTTQARVGAVNAQRLAESHPTARLLARTYAEQVPISDVTVAARVTILRDATVLLVVGVIILGTAWSFR